MMITTTAESIPMMAMTINNSTRVNDDSLFVVILNGVSPPLSRATEDQGKNLTYRCFLWSAVALAKVDALLSMTGGFAVLSASTKAQDDKTPRHSEAQPKNLVVLKLDPSLRSG
ncbi:MAG: hypothetical protein M1312_00040 [Patescibacteria group bacterium]|nr:hypothetical protein [Patescibacteria group bacterium]